MTCQKIKEKFPDFLIGDLSQKEMSSVQTHIASCTVCRQELESLSATWTKLGVLPEEQPSSSLRSRFYSMLEDYKNELTDKKTKPAFKGLWRGWIKTTGFGKPVFQFSFALILLFMGLAAGYFFSGGSGRTSEIASLRQEMISIKETLVFSLLEQQSAAERLRGVSMSANLENPDSGLLQALLDTLKADPNINVRLAAVDALYLFYGNPQVREGIISALSSESSPIIQVALIDLMVNMRERSAVESLKNLIQTKTINPDVKKHAELGLQKIGM